jgi:hypothetical protein
LAVCVADPAINPYFSVRHLKAIERRKSRSGTLGKRKRAVDSECKAQMEETKACVLESRPVLADSTAHNSPTLIKKRRVSSDQSIASTTSTILTDTRSSRHHSND